MTKVKEFLGYCPTQVCWTDQAMVGFFVLGIALGTVLGMCLLKVII